MTWVAITAAFVLVVSACGSGVTQDEYDAVLAERDALSDQLDNANDELENANDEHDSTKAELLGVNTALGESQGEAESLGADLANEQARIESLEADRNTARNALECANAASAAYWFGYLWIEQELYEELVNGGTPIEVADEILDLIDSPWYPLENYAGSNSLFEWGNYLQDIGDADLDAAWQDWLDSEFGSNKEMFAKIEMDLRVALNLEQCLEDGLDATGPKG